MIAFINKLKNNNIIKSSVGLVFITLAVKIFGYAEKVVLAYYFGTCYQVDVYTLILTIVLSIFFFFREIIEPGFLNVFMISKLKGDETTTWNLFNKTIRGVLLITLLISFFSLLFPSVLVKIFAPGFGPEKWALSEKLIPIVIPACIFLAISTITSITLNGQKIFVLPASGELVFKGLIIFFIVLLYKQFGIVGAAFGILAGSAGRLMVHLTKLYKKISFKTVPVDKVYKKQMWVLTWPLLLGVGFSQLSGIIDNVFASYLGEGSIAALNYSKKIVELPIIVFPYILSVVVFPYFSQLSIEKDNQRLNHLLGESLRWIILTFLPLSVFFFAFSNEITSVIFQRGAFDAYSTLLTSKPLSVYSIGMIFFAIETIIVIFYFAKGETKTPVFVGMICVVLNIGLTYVLVRLIGYTGIAYAFVIQKIVKNVVLLLLLNKKVQPDIKGIFSFLMKSVVAAFIFSVLIIVFKKYFTEFLIAGLIIKTAFLGGLFVFAGIFYFISLYFSGLLRSRID